MSPITRLMVAVVAFLSALQGGCSGAVPKDGIVWRWHAPDTELYQPAFSPDATEITLVRKHHIPDGHEAESIPEEKIQEEMRRVEANERIADPEVVVMRVGTGEITRIDWGWSPTFSPDGKSIAFAHQVKPISRFRVLAETLAGNDIRVHDRAARTTAVVARPGDGYLSDPIFSPDGRSLIYSIAGPVNGAFGGNIGLESVALHSGTARVLYPPIRDFDLPHLVDPKAFVGGRIHALVRRPAAPGRYLAEQYDCELLDIGPPATVVHSWGRRRILDQSPMACAQGADGKPVIYSGAWRAAGDGAGPSHSETLSPPSDPGVPSPDGRLLARTDQSTVTIGDLPAGSKQRSWTLQHFVREVRWSPDSKSVAVIVTRFGDEAGEIFAFDELVIITP